MKQSIHRDDFFHPNGDTHVPSLEFFPSPEFVPSPELSDDLCKNLSFHNIYLLQGFSESYQVILQEVSPFYLLSERQSALLAAATLATSTLMTFRS